MDTHITTSSLDCSLFVGWANIHNLYFILSLNSMLHVSCLTPHVLSCFMLRIRYTTIYRRAHDRYNFKKDRPKEEMEEIRSIEKEQKGHLIERTQTKEWNTTCDELMCLVGYCGKIQYQTKLSINAYIEHSDWIPIPNERRTNEINEPLKFIPLLKSKDNNNNNEQTHTRAGSNEKWLTLSDINRMAWTFSLEILKANYKLNMHNA